MDNHLTICAILGAGNDDAGNIDSDAIQRCDLAIEMLSINKQAQLILCGGFGDHFNITDQQHYRYLKKYIESKQNNFEESILGCVDSYNTIDDIQGINVLLQRLIFNKIKLVIITNDYHVLRASILAKKIITSGNVSVQFLSVSSLKDIAMLSSRLEHEVGRIKEYLREK
ncbi:hypothetical protein [uncultured Gammaproteobacteria bacterium]|nr:hypothetical protein [uncultured Gammaproteobacteria bacterium]